MIKFNELISDIFNRYLLFEEEYSLYFSVEELEFALKNLIPIYDKLLIEEKIPYILNIPDKLIDLIESNYVLNKDDILSCVDESWKFYNKLKSVNLHPIYIGKFDFNSFDEINDFFDNLTGVEDEKLLKSSIGMILKLYKNANRFIRSDSK